MYGLFFVEKKQKQKLGHFFTGTHENFKIGFTKWTSMNFPWFVSSYACRLQLISMGRVGAGFYGGVAQRGPK